MYCCLSESNKVLARPFVVWGSWFVDRNSTIAFNFEHLDVYQLAVDLVNDMYILTKHFPKEEMFGLTSQLRRAGVSIASNIAEGSARTNKEFAHFVNIARGSVLECVTLIEVAYKQNYLAEKEFMEVKAKLVRLSKMLSGLRRAINHKPTAKISNPKPRTPNPEPQAGFTLIELVVAVGILAMVISFAGVIFRVSIDSQRTAAANAEILQKLRVITEQLDADFEGLLYSYGGSLGASTDRLFADGRPVDVNSDSIIFFSAGDFQSTRQYGGKTMVGNAACIFYCQPDPNSFIQPYKPQERILLRRQTILTPDGPSATSDPRGEYYSKSLSEWRIAPPFSDLDDWVRRPVIEPNNIEEYLPMYVAKGVDNFTIYYAEQWDDAKGPENWKRRPEDNPGGISPIAFKFEFTLYDSKGIIRNGRTFTHIVLVPRGG